jgi:hypothetical protein
VRGRGRANAPNGMNRRERTSRRQQSAAGNDGFREGGMAEADPKRKLDIPVSSFGAAQHC